MNATQLKRIPQKQAKVIAIKPAYLSLKDAMNYVSMKRGTFSHAASTFDLRAYSYGTRNLWYKVEDLNEMMESFKLKT